VEPWIESAINWKELQKSLNLRGYQKVPIHAANIINVDKEELQKGNLFPIMKLKIPEIKTMLRKRKN